MERSRDDQCELEIHRGVIQPLLPLLPHQARRHIFSLITLKVLQQALAKKNSQNLAYQRYIAYLFCARHDVVDEQIVFFRSGQRRTLRQLNLRPGWRAGCTVAWAWCRLNRACLIGRRFLCDLHGQVAVVRSRKRSLGVGAAGNVARQFFVIRFWDDRK